VLYDAQPLLQLFAVGQVTLAHGSTGSGSGVGAELQLVQTDEQQLVEELYDAQPYVQLFALGQLTPAHGSTGADSQLEHPPQELYDAHPYVQLLSV